MNCPVIPRLEAGITLAPVASVRGFCCNTATVLAAPGGIGRDPPPFVARQARISRLLALVGILDGQRMQIELPLHPLQKIVTWLDKPDPDDMARPFRPFTSLLDWDIGDFAAPGINSRINDA
jgi:hypothetical protein